MSTQAEMFQGFVEQNGSDNARMLLHHARSMVPKLRERVLNIDELRRIPQETIDELHALGLFKLLVPTRYGGYQLSFCEYIDIVAELGRGCGSTAWVVSLINVTKWLTSVGFTEQVHQEVFGQDGNANICGVFEPRKCNLKRVEGGYRIEEGLWGFCSGSWHSDYFFLGIPLLNDTGEVQGMGAALIPKKDLTIHDDWHVMSMRGTGSNSVSVKDVFVPDYRVTSISDDIEGRYPSVHLRDQALYRSAFIPVAAYVLTGPGLGLIRSAYEHCMERLPNRRIQYTWYTKQAEAAVTHLQLAEAVMKIDTAHMHLYRAGQDIDRWAESGKYMDFNTRARVRADCSYATRVSMEAVEILFSASGGSAIAESNALQRIMRDMKSPNLHGLLVPTTGLEMFGRVLAKQQPNTPLI